MKRAMVYLIAISALVSALLSGCGEMGTKAPATTPAPSATVKPQETMLPETMLPDESDGIVKDTDGIIEDSDTGTGTTADSGAAGTTASAGSAAAKSGTANGSLTGTGIVRRTSGSTEKAEQR